MPRPGPPAPRAAEGVTVVVSVRRDQGDLAVAVDDLLSTLDRVGERHCVLLVLADDSPPAAGDVAAGLADRYPDRVRAVRRGTGEGGHESPRTGLAVALAETDHRRIFLTDGRIPAAQLPPMLATARAERADLVVAYWRDHLDTRRGRSWLRAVVLPVASRTGRLRQDPAHHLVDRRTLTDLDLTARAAGSRGDLLDELRRRDARILVRDLPGRDGGGSAVSVPGVRKSLVRGAVPPRDPLLWAVLAAAVVLSVGACAAVAASGTTLAYPDAVSHLLISRRVLDASTPGAAQLGGVWLPLPHVLTLPLVVTESWSHAGVLPSAVSMGAYVAAAGWLYRIALALTGRRAGAVVAVLVFCANPNVLYLQSTPMTEALLLACLAAATWHLLRWCRQGDYRHLLATALAVFCSTLVRYEGWVFLAAVAVVVAVRSWQRSRGTPDPLVLVRADLVFFGCLAVSGAVGWAMWNAAIFGDPLQFVRGEFAKPALWVGEAERAVGDWSTSLRTYGYAAVHVLGPVVAVSGVVGLGCFAWRTRLRDAALAPLPLLVFLPFFVCALYSGQRPLHVPEIGGDLYNVRFALVMVLPAAVFTAYLVAAPGRAPFRLLPAVVVLVGCGQLFLSAPVTAREAEVFRASAAERANAQAATWLREHYDGGRVLMQSWSNETVGFDSRVPTALIVYEGSFRQWEEALGDPVGRGVRWIHMRRTPGGEDEVWRRLHDSPLMHFPYKPAYADDHHVFYRRVDLPAPDQPTPRAVPE
ncbi:glycosyltransferase family 39 protein [Actinosynnema sp. NPDC053489]|uniref:glycosyltransferase family 39 protein n=1 Tax=Actinosynnema sp. NPDC053489 TaxID=3363916 RepID=UPI0037CA4533